MFMIIIVTILCVLWWLIFLKSNMKYRTMINEFPGPITYPILGNALEFSSKPDVMFSVLRNYYKKYEHTYRLWVGQFATIHLVVPEDVEILLSSTKQIQKGFFYKFIMPWLGTGLLTSTGNKWQKRRKILTPAFHFGILRRFTHIFAENSEKIVSQLRKECYKPKIDIVPFITNCTLNVICETAMGTNLKTNDQKDNQYYETIYRLGKCLIYRAITPWLYNDFIFNLTLSGWKQKKYLRILHDFTDNVIKERENAFQDSDVQNLDGGNEDNGKKRLAMLDLLIDAKKNRGDIDDVGIREEVDTFTFEGHDTTSMALCFALLLLSNHSDIQDKIVEELEEIFDTARSATYQDLQNMRYLEMCLKECLRLYPSVPLISRTLTEDLLLNKGVAPAGCTAIVHIYDLHRNPQYFPDPEKFDPDRFLPENVKGRHPFAFIPFSAGPRNCIGKKFAMLEMKSIVSTILRNFVLEAVDTPLDMELCADIVLRNKGPIYITLKPRLSKKKFENSNCNL